MTIDESASILSDISYDKTDDSLVSLFEFKLVLNKQEFKRVSFFPIYFKWNFGIFLSVTGLGLLHCEDGATQETRKKGMLSTRALFPLSNI